jgi:NADPH:quinone reductase-like Zn-dependent oxidoreductase
MRAAQISEYGGKDVLRTVANAPKPIANAGEVLVEVHAASANPFDWKIRQGYTRSLAELSFPATLGGDFAGVVVETGDGVNTVHVGEEVYGQTNPLGGQGSFAEFTPVKVGSVAPKPRGIDFIHAAAAALTGVSAYQALVELMNLQRSQKVLIHGGAGGIGTLAIQLAKYLGAYVATTVATDDTVYAKDLGADEVIDYKTTRFEDIVKGYDGVFDTVGGDTYSRSFEVLKDGGVLVSMVEQPNEELARHHHVKALHQFTQCTTERLTKVAELIDNGTLHVHVDRTFPLEQASEALGYLQEGHPKGKIAIVVKS